MTDLEISDMLELYRLCKTSKFRISELDNVGQNVTQNAHSRFTRKIKWSNKFSVDICWKKTPMGS